MILHDGCPACATGLELRRLHGWAGGTEASSHQGASGDQAGGPGPPQPQSVMRAVETPQPPTAGCAGGFLVESVGSCLTLTAPPPGALGDPPNPFRGTQEAMAVSPGGGYEEWKTRA